MNLWKCPHCADFNPITSYACSKCGQGLNPSPKKLPWHGLQSHSRNVQGVLFVVSMVPLLFQIDGLENTLGGLKLFWWSLAIGIAAGVGIAHRLASRRLSSPSKETSPGSLYLFWIWVCAFLAPAAAGMLNRYGPGPTQQKRVFTVTGQCTARSKGNSTYYLLFRNGPSQERVHVSKALFHRLKSGQSMVFTLRPGFLGFPVVDDVT